MTDPDSRLTYQREFHRHRRAVMPTWIRLMQAWSAAEKLQRGVRITHPGDHHIGIRMLKYGTFTAPEGHQLNRLCDARTCDAVYAVKRGSGFRLLCPNPEHYESGPPDGGSEVRYMKEKGRIPW